MVLFLLSWNGNRWTESLHFLETLFSSVKCWVPCLTENHSMTERNSPPLRNRMTTLVCDSQPYNVQMIKCLGIPEPREYYAKLRQVLTERKIEKDEYHIKLIAEELFSSTGYRQYLTNEEMALLIHEQGNLVVACQYLRREDTNMVILKTTVPGYFNCYVLENKISEIDMDIVGLELLLYMEVNKPVPTLINEMQKIPLRNFQKIGVTILAIPYATAQVG